MAGADVAHCIEALRASGCKKIAILWNSPTRSAMCDECLGPASKCDHGIIYKSTEPVILTAQVQSA